MNIRELVNTYINKGYNYRNAQNLAAEEIILKKIASSNMAEHVTLKGGIVMYNLTKSDRRVTQDIDFDFIRYSIDKESIKLFIDKMNNVDDDLTIFINGDIEELHQEDYQGVRVHIIIKDNDNNRLRLKLDIGVHTYFAIEQEKLVFNFASNDERVSIKVNPPEQIIAEKLISLGRLGAISTRYKDLYDIYFLIDRENVSLSKVKTTLELFLNNSNRRPNELYEIVNSIEETLNNKDFIVEASKPASRWIDVDYNTVKTIILDFIHRL